MRPNDRDRHHTVREDRAFQQTTATFSRFLSFVFPLTPHEGSPGGVVSPDSPAIQGSYPIVSGVRRVGFVELANHLVSIRSNSLSLSLSLYPAPSPGGVVSPESPAKSSTYAIVSRLCHRP